jgi:anaerobic selenocysteine-containing dehydrogenase
MEEGPFVELHEVDAAARAIGEGDRVRVWNDRAELSLTARISQRVRPGLTAIPWGWWGPELNVNALTNDTDTDWGGGAAFYDTLVEVAKG